MKRPVRIPQKAKATIPAAAAIKALAPSAPKAAASPLYGATVVVGVYGVTVVLDTLVETTTDVVVGA